MPTKYPGDTVHCTFAAINRGTSPATLRAKVKLDGYVPEIWQSLGQVPGGQSRTFTITRTLKQYTGTHHEDAELWVEADGREVYHEFWNELYTLLPGGEKVQVTSVIWGSPMPDIAKILAQSYL